MFNSNCIFWNPINLVIIVLNEHVRTLSGPWWLGRVSVSILTFLTYSPEVVCSLNWEKQVQVPLSSCRDNLGQVFSRSHQFFGDTPLHPRCGLCTHCLSMFQDLGSHIVPWPFIPLTRHSLEAEWVAGCGLLPRGPVESSSPMLSPSLTLLLYQGASEMAWESHGSTSSLQFGKAGKRLQCSEAAMAKGPREDGFVCVHPSGDPGDNSSLAMTSPVAWDFAQ